MALVDQRPGAHARDKDGPPGQLGLAQSPALVVGSMIGVGVLSLRYAVASYGPKSGCSVLVRVEGTYVGPINLPTYRDRPVAWAEGQRTLHVRITPHDISGTRLLAS